MRHFRLPSFFVTWETGKKKEYFFIQTVKRVFNDSVNTFITTVNVVKCLVCICFSGNWLLSAVTDM